MINRQANLYLISLPCLLMGAVHCVFALLSWLVFEDACAGVFAELGITISLASIALMYNHRAFDASRIGYRDALVFAVLTWVLMGLLGSAPIMVLAHTSFTDAVFESVSGLTTTGATILSGLDSMPPSFLLYRQFLQWLGGLGVVIFVVAVLPMLNVGGMKLLKAETPGPIKDDKVSPRVSSTSRYLWMVYLVITALCAIGYYFVGMTPFDAIAHAFTTVSTGGFSTHDASLGYFDSRSVMAVSDLFMLAGAVSFALHYQVANTKNIKLYWRDEETRTFLLIVVLLSLLLAWGLAHSQHYYYHHILHAINDATFILISIITSTGYGAVGFTDWPLALLVGLIFAGYLGGCAGSTAGGNKIVRNILSAKIITMELKQLIHPRGVFMVKYQHKPVEASVLSATIAFMSLAAITTIVLSIALMATGLDFWSSLSALAACVNVLGPGFGELSNNFAPVSDAGTWLLSGAMILGRLEYFTVLALFSPGFWKR